MRTREKLTLEEKFALALALIKRERSLDEIRIQYRISHTTAYKIRNAFLEGGRAALGGDRRAPHSDELEARVRALEVQMGNGADGTSDARVEPGNGRDGRGHGRVRRVVGRLKTTADVLASGATDQTRRAGK